MKTTIVPAEVTTVEDRIMGSLSFTQLLLLMAPLFLSVVIYILLPPFFSGELYKFVAIAVITCSFLILALRFKGVILLHSLLLRLRFHRRPRLYLYNKNTDVARQNTHQSEPVNELTKTEKTSNEVSLRMPDPHLSETLRAMSVLDDPMAQVHFKTTRKGGLYVSISHSKDSK